MNRARAAVFRGVPGAFELEEFPLPRLEPGAALVRVLGTTLCGSDLHSFRGRRTVAVPTVLGHEIVGQLVESRLPEPAVDLLGQPLCVGDRVSWAIVAHCGRCPLCLRGIPQKCQRAVKYGHEALVPGRELLGGLADYCLLVPGTSLVRLPTELSLAAACPASCATATVAAAWAAAALPEVGSVCVLGAGLLGLTACAWARSRGAVEVISVDPQPARRALARSFGATQVTSPEDLAELTRATVGELGFDLALELSGRPDAFEAAWPRLRIGGTLVLVGSVFPAPPVGLALEQVVRRLLTIRGVHNYAPGHLAAAVEFLDATREQYPWDQLVARWYSLADVVSAFEDAESSGAIRIGIRPETPGD